MTALEAVQVTEEQKTARLDNRTKVTEEVKFQIYYRDRAGESRYGIAKSLSLTSGYITRLIEGDSREGRKARPAFEQLLQSDQGMKARYGQFVQQFEAVFEERAWSRRDFNSLPIIQHWRESIRLRGSPSSLTHISPIRRICTGEMFEEFRCSPDRFVLNLNIRADSPVKKFVSLYLEKTGRKKVSQGHSIAIRDFLATCHNISIPKNLGHLYGLSGAKDSYGKHSMIALTNSHWLSILKDLLTMGNLRLAAKVAVGCEGFPRSETLDNLNPGTFKETRKEVEGLLGHYYVFEKLESKTLKHRQTPFRVEILHPVAIEITRRYLEVFEPREHMFVDGMTNNQAREQYMEDNSNLRKFYEGLKLKDAYFFMNPTYTFRHTGAIRCMMRCGGDAVRVAKRGWMETKTLLDCYAGLSTDDDFEAKTCYECRPPKYPSVDEERFCSLKCCLVYYTKHYEEIIRDFVPLIKVAGA